MKPTEKGWLQQYISFRKSDLIALVDGSRKSAHPEQALYQVIQPTGLMYGQSVEVIAHPDAKSWNEKDRMKVLMAESLICSALLFHDKQIKDEDELSVMIQKTLENISNYYNSIFPELATSPKTFLGRKKTPVELAEKIIEKRIDIRSQSANNFWILFFNNSLLFLDIYIFGQWIHTNADRIVSDFFKYERDELRFSLVKIIAAAAHANTTIEYEERRLLEYFLASSGLSLEYKREALQIFEQGVEIEAINLPTSNSWILKKYFLEMAILTIWSDKQVETQELLFLRKLCEYMGFSDDDLENSLIALEGFVLEHWEELDQLQNKQDYEQLSEQFISRMARITEKNKNRLIRETQERGELMVLLRKANGAELTSQEKIELRNLLIVVLKTIPTLVIITLPQHFLTLPNLLKILPRDFFASALNQAN